MSTRFSFILAFIFSYLLTKDAGQQTSHVYNSAETNLGLQNTTQGYSFHFQHRNPKTLQLKALRMIVDTPWFVPNTVIQRDLQTPSVKEEIHHYSYHTVLASVHTQMTY
jgi:hypothetical protein